ncbi:hypothetical protein MBLNU457_g2897t1 [Dothideomycetes sp. NU457]
MVKRKIEELAEKSAVNGKASAKAQKKSLPPAEKKSKTSNTKAKPSDSAVKPTFQPSSIQIIVGSYERVLHGSVVTLHPKTTHKSNSIGESDNENATFTDTFLFSAHSSSLRSLAVSQSSESHKRILATGGSDERINLYNISSVPPQLSRGPKKPTLSRTSVLENPKNRELGSLLHHARAVTKVQFPTRGKLFSAAEDNTIAISRVRDWTVLSTIKVPIPKPIGRPSGDTAAAGEVPAGVNDFAVHPSMKLMVSVGRGEKSMRLWNLVTGKKAGVLTFDRDLLIQVGEGKYSSGEGRRVLWTECGEDFIVGFERGAAIFGMDCKPKAVIRPSPPTKIHQMRILPADFLNGIEDVVAVSTEDGRIIFYAINDATSLSEATDSNYAVCKPFAQLGGAEAGIPGRVKDFEVLSLPSASADSKTLAFAAASSDGAVRIWTLDSASLQAAKDAQKAESAAVQVGDLTATLETGNRITCLAAFVMDEPGEDDGDEDGEEVFGGFSDDEGSDEE